jgi:hypothetical protein
MGNATMLPILSGFPKVTVEPGVDKDLGRLWIRGIRFASVKEDPFFTPDLQKQNAHTSDRYWRNRP